MPVAFAPALAAVVLVARVPRLDAPPPAGAVPAPTVWALLAGTLLVLGGAAVRGYRSRVPGR